MAKRFSLHIAEPSDELFAVALQAEAQIFLRAFKNTPEVMEREYGPYRQSSVFLIVRDDRRNNIAGIIRLIKNSPAGFKSLNDLEAAPWGGRTVSQILKETHLQIDPARTIDIATLGVEVGYRRKDSAFGAAVVSAALYYALVRYSVEHKVVHWVTILDDRVLQLVQQNGAQFQRYAGIDSASYLESIASTPVWSNFPQALKSATLFQKLIFAHGLIVRMFVRLNGSRL